MTEAANQPLQRTCLHGEHVALGARMVPFGGWDMPVTYAAGQLAEHRAVRNAVGIFDVSHMGQVRFTGAGALAFLEQIVPGDLRALLDAQSKYTQLCNEGGGIIDDLIVSRLGRHEYFAVVNASTRVGDVQWMREKARELKVADCNIADESDRWGMIAVQGPQALGMLDRLIAGKIWSNTPPFTLHAFEMDGAPHFLSRTGYTGEAGGELLCPAELAATWWKRFLEAGAVPCGLAARDSLRLEAGYCLYGNDLGLDTTPVEAGLSWTVGWKKTAKYIGRDVLEKQKVEGVSKKLVGLRTESRRPLRQHDKVTRNGVEVGEVTSGGFSPLLECGIAMAYVQSDAAKAEDLQITSKTGSQPAKVVKPPFVDIGLKKS
ncbi:glycine cleavage system aminomethyltransferase GcvT [Candidatus Sumerlaeota bacterium]|nr:glycine cleavage system aminomethyltransferase GcvT [Candidatus Sumerlaeota bacterium]